MNMHAQGHAPESARLSEEDQLVISISEHPDLPSVSDTYYNCGVCDHVSNESAALSPSVFTS